MFKRDKQLNFSKYFSQNLESLFGFELSTGPLTPSVVQLPKKAFNETVSQLDGMSGWYSKSVVPEYHDWFLIHEAFHEAVRKLKYPWPDRLYDEFLKLCIDDLDAQISLHCTRFQDRYLELSRLQEVTSIEVEDFQDLLSQKFLLSDNPLIGISDRHGWYLWSMNSQSDLPLPVQFVIDYREFGWTKLRFTKLFLGYKNEPNQLFQIQESD